MAHYAKTAKNKTDAKRQKQKPLQKQKRHLHAKRMAHYVQTAKTKLIANRQKQIVEHLDRKHKTLYNNKHKNTLSREVHEYV